MSLLDRLRPHRIILGVTAVLGFVGLNGPFLYFAFLHPDVVTRAATNPVGLVFMLEALVLTVGAAWLIHLSELERPGWIAFLVMTVVGSLAFSVPAFLLVHLSRTAGSDEDPAAP